MNFRSLAVVVSAIAALGLVACKSTGTGGEGGSGGSGGGTGGEAATGGGGGGVGGGGSTCDEAYTCADAIDPDAGDPSKLCEGAQADLYDALVACTCTGACASACGDNACAEGGTASADCITCLQDTGAGCGNDFQNCANGI